MKLSIRIKLVALLAVIALLPLVAAIVTIVVGGSQFRSEAVGQAIQSMAASEATTLRVSLTKDIEKLRLTMNEPVFHAHLADQHVQLSDAKLKEMDDAWPGLPVDRGIVGAILNNPAALELQRIRREDPRLAELFITDRYGQLVAATGKTSDYYQGDEAWWQGVADGERKRIFIPPVSFDASSGVWSIDLCVPILDDGKFLGVAKAVLDVSQWISGPTVQVGKMEAAVTFVRSDGSIVYHGGEGPAPNLRPLSGSGGLDEANWSLAQDGKIQAHAPICLPEKIGDLDLAAPRWSLVLEVPKAQAFGPIIRLGAILLAGGLLAVVGIFLVGLVLVDRIVVRRVHRLGRATKRIARGDLSHRIDTGGALSGPGGKDEIDELAENFNEMLAQIEKSHDELAATNELKMKFIRIAGHELRTPVSYILAMARLLKDSEDPARLLHGIQSMGSKAKRLDEIIQAMFKLMPDQKYSEDVHYGDVDLSELLEEIYLDCFPFVERRGQRLLMEGTDRISHLRADREKLRNILENLVMNAIKFTPDGGTIKVRIGQELGGYAAFRVQDQGPGISEEDLPHIFDPFYSGGDVLMHSTGQAGYGKRGMGLGLAIVKHFTELHKGKVSVTSGPHGSVFAVTIPIEKPHAAEGSAS